MSALLLFRPRAGGGPPAAPDADPYALTFTIADDGHSFTVRERDFTFTTREQRG